MWARIASIPVMGRDGKDRLIRFQPRAPLIPA
jgi:hypothetical protein